LAARAAIEEIAADAIAHFDPDRFGPVHGFAGNVYLWDCITGEPRFRRSMCSDPNTRRVRVATKKEPKQTFPADYGRAATTQVAAFNATAA
jgi:hypothetical protein